MLKLAHSFFAFALALCAGQAQAVEKLTICDSCSSVALRGAAISSGRTYDPVYVGDRSQGILHKFVVEAEPNGRGGYMYIVLPRSVESNKAAAFGEYARAWRNAKARRFVIDLGDTSTAAGMMASAAGGLPQSAFDVTSAGAARSSLMNWISNQYNWSEWGASHLFLLKSAYMHMKQFFTGGEFKIKITIKFPDDTEVDVQYESETQSFTFVEARDSAGAPIAITPPTPSTLVDYSHWRDPSAHYRPDYDRAMLWFMDRGIPITNGSQWACTITPLTGVNCERF